MDAFGMIQAHFSGLCLGDCHCGNSHMQVHILRVKDKTRDLKISKRMTKIRGDMRKIENKRLFFYDF